MIWYLMSIPYLIYDMVSDKHLISIPECLSESHNVSHINEDFPYIVIYVEGSYFHAYCTTHHVKSFKIGIYDLHVRFIDFPKHCKLVASLLMYIISRMLHAICTYVHQAYVFKPI